EGASVSVDGTSIGTTEIIDKQIKPADYRFTFHLAGYADAEREYRVAAGLERDSFTQVLTSASTGGTPLTTTAPGPNPAGGPSSGDPSFYGMPVGYIILGGIIVVLALALVARRRR